MLDVAAHAHSRWHAAHVALPRPEHAMPATQNTAPPSVPPPRKATNVSMGADLLAEAKASGIHVSQAAEAGLARAVAENRAELWLEANRPALESSNAYLERNGLPLDSHRRF